MAKLCALLVLILLSCTLTSASAQPASAGLSTQPERAVTQPAANSNPANPISQARPPAATAALGSENKEKSDPEFSWLEVACFLVVGGITIWLGIYTDMLRDSEPVDFGGAKPSENKTYRRPYSLAQTQMAWWFCVILASFICLVLAGKDIRSILTQESLILMGIGAATALSATGIEQVKGSPSSSPGKTSTLDQFKSVLNLIASLPAGAPVPQNLIDQRNKLAKALASEGFFRDILTDIDGICLYRFQAVVWTVVLGVIFIIQVWQQGAFPILGTTLLTALGISNGTYLGFKVPEQPA